MKEQKIGIRRAGAGLRHTNIVAKLRKHDINLRVDFLAIGGGGGGGGVRKEDCRGQVNRDRIIHPIRMQPKDIMSIFFGGGLIFGKV